MPPVEQIGKWFHFMSEHPIAMFTVHCPYGEVGDHLWLKETHARVHPGILQSLDPDPKSAYWNTIYRASEGLGDYEGRVHWKPSIFMRREFSRITLEITGVRVERLQDISEEDAKAEGVRQWHEPNTWTHDGIRIALCARTAFRNLWESINGPGSWDANPWVWVIQFRRLQQL